MTPYFAQIGSFSGTKPVSVQHLNQTIFDAVSPAAVSCSPDTGVSLTQPCSSDKIDEGTILVLSDVLTSCMVGNHNNDNGEKFFQSHLFFSQSEEEENQKL